MEKEYTEKIIQNYLKNRYPAETEKKIQFWLTEEERIAEKERALIDHWDQLHVHPDIFIYDSLDQVKNRIKSLDAGQVVPEVQDIPEVIIPEETEPELKVEIEEQVNEGPAPIIFSRQQLEQNPLVESHWRDQIADVVAPVPVIDANEPVIAEAEIPVPEPIVFAVEPPVKPPSWKNTEIIIDPDDAPLTGMEMNLGKRVSLGTRLLQIAAVLIALLAIAGVIWFFITSAGKAI